MKSLKSFRAVLVLWHRGFGLLAGLWLFLLALTGSVIVFYEELDHTLNPDLWTMSMAGQHLPFAELVEAAERSHPGSYASFVDLPDDPQKPLVAYLATRPDAEAVLPARLHVFVDPYSGKVLGDRVFGALRFDRRHLSHLIYQLHMDLKLGNIMATFLGLVALMWVFDHLPACWLSFPNPKHWWRSFKIRKGARGVGLAYLLHRAVGLWLLPVTLTLAVSGVYFNWYPIFVSAVDKVSPVTTGFEKTAPRLETPNFEPATDLDEAMVGVARLAGGAPVDSILVLPFQGLYLVRLKDPRDLASYGQRQICVDMTTGEVLSDRHPMAGSAGDAFLAWQYPLHSGKAFGRPGRLIIFLAGLAVCALTATGFILWAKKWRGRRKLAMIQGNL